MKHLFFLSLLSFSLLSCNMSKNEYEIKEGEMTWLTINQAEDLSNKEGKMYFIDMYTDWCGWCKVMDKKTFSDPTVIALMNQHFHSVKFDAEQKEAANFNNKEYKWKPGGRNGVNELAVDLLKGRLSYPSFVVLDKNKAPIQIIKGYKAAEDFKKTINSIVN